MTLIDFHNHKATAWDGEVFTPSSFAIHPWDAQREEAPTFDAFRQKYEAHFRQAMLVGECGLDRRCDVPLERQLQLFEWQLTLADELQKTVVIHCVHAFDLLLALRKRHPDVPWVLHGFRGGTPQLLQLQRASVIPSFGAALLDPRNGKLREALRDCDGPFLLETDTADCPVSQIYAEAAILKKIPLDELRQTIISLCSRLLGTDISACIENLSNP